MLNVEKIRLMTKLSMYDKKEGKAIRDVSSYFKGDYISRKVFSALVHYTLCFLLLVGLLMVMDMEELLMHLNIPFITAAIHVLLFLYVLGLVAMLLFTYVRYARTYDELHRKSLYYMAKLDKLLEMEETGDASGEEEEWLDDPIEPENGWLDDPEADELSLSTGTHSSDDGIQLMKIKKKQ